MTSSATNPTVQLASDVIDILAYLADVLDIAIDQATDNKCATMLNCAERYLNDVQVLCEKTIAEQKGGVQ